VAAGDDLLVELDQESVPGGEAGRSRLRDNPDVPTALRDALRPVHVARDLTYRPAQRPDEVLHRRRNDRFQFGVLRQVFNQVSHQPDN
jgi:hypothetical protein